MGVKKTAATPRTTRRARIALILAAIAAAAFGATSHALVHSTADIAPPMQAASE